MSEAGDVGEIRVALPKFDLGHNRPLHHSFEQNPPRVYATIDRPEMQVARFVSRRWEIAGGNWSERVRLF